MNKLKLSSIAIGLSLIIVPMLAHGQEAPGRFRSTPPTGSSSEQRRPIQEIEQRLSNDRIGSTTPRLGRPEFASSTGTSTPRDMQAEIRRQIDQKRNELKDLNQASSTDGKNNSLGQRNERKELRVDIFKLQQNRIVNQLKRSLENLNQVRNRIQNRIDKAVQNGKDMTSVKALLVIADSKLALAKSSVDSFAAFSPATGTPVMSSVSSTSSSATTSSINLDKPRQMASSTIAAIKDARDALNNVVTALAQALGINNNHEATSSTATNTPPQNNDGNPVICSQEAMLCPDGSYVSRVGPRCEFKACPSTGTTTNR